MTRINERRSVGHPTRRERKRRKRHCRSDSHLHQARWLARVTTFTTILVPRAVRGHVWDASLTPFLRRRCPILQVRKFSTELQVLKAGIPAAELKTAGSGYIARRSLLGAHHFAGTVCAGTRRCRVRHTPMETDRMATIPLPNAAPRSSRPNCTVFKTVDRPLRVIAAIAEARPGRSERTPNDGRQGTARDLLKVASRKSRQLGSAGHRPGAPWTPRWSWRYGTAERRGHWRRRDLPDRGER